MLPNLFNQINPYSLWSRTLQTPTYLASCPPKRLKHSSLRASSANHYTLY